MVNLEFYLVVDTINQILVGAIQGYEFIGQRIRQIFMHLIENLNAPTIKFGII